ncbi:MAG TPA: hypothetical protein VLF17_07055 [Candidatus Nitrosotenuis sp.]|nr:hypothetical protein [Candidatus Nitrosotenuis sp.]
MSVDSEAVRIIRLLLGSEAANYLESGERLHLNTCLQKAQLNGALDDKELETVRRVFQKYQRYLG